MTRQSLIGQVTVDCELTMKLLPERALVIGVYRHDPPRGEIGATKDRARPGGPPASSAAAPDVPPGKLGLKLGCLLVPP